MGESITHMSGNNIGQACPNCLLPPSLLNLNVLSNCILVNLQIRLLLQLEELCWPQRCLDAQKLVIS